MAEDSIATEDPETDQEKVDTKKTSSSLHHDLLEDSLSIYLAHMNQELRRNNKGFRKLNRKYKKSKDYLQAAIVVLMRIRTTEDAKDCRTMAHTVLEALGEI